MKRSESTNSCLQFFRVLTVIQVVACLLVLAPSSASHAWYAKTHHEMTRAALDSLPHEMKKHLNEDRVLYGANEPDGTVYDPNAPDGYRKIRSSQTISGSMHGNPDQIGRISRELENELSSANKQWERISLLMGQLAHHIQDLNQPFHAAELFPSRYSKKDLQCHPHFEDLAKHNMSGYIRSTSAMHAKRSAADIGRQSLAYLDKVSPNKCLQATDLQTCCQNQRIPGRILKRIANHSVKDTVAYWFDILKRASEKEKRKPIVDPWPRNQDRPQGERRVDPYNFYEQRRSHGCQSRCTEPTDGSEWCCPNYKGCRYCPTARTGNKHSCYTSSGCWMPPR